MYPKKQVAYCGLYPIEMPPSCERVPWCACIENIGERHFSLLPREAFLRARYVIYYPDFFCKLYTKANFSLIDNFLRVYSWAHQLYTNYTP